MCLLIQLVGVHSCIQVKWRDLLSLMYSRVACCRYLPPRFPFDVSLRCCPVQEQGQAIAATVYLDAALKFLLAASSIEVFDAKQASSIYRETAAYLE